MARIYNFAKAHTSQRTSYFHGNAQIGHNNREENGIVEVTSIGANKGYQ